VPRHPGADQFIVRRPLCSDPTGYSVIAGYPWFGDWGRDTMISLPDLPLATGRPEIARRTLRTFGRFVDQGMLPNRFPDAGEVPEYNQPFLQPLTRYLADHGLGSISEIFDATRHSRPMAASPRPGASPSCCVYGAP
jgi:glycogen debranching enzyme